MGSLATELTIPEVSPYEELDDDLRARVKAELASGERLLWAGRPTRHSCPGGAMGPWVIWCLGLWSIFGAGVVLYHASGGNEPFPPMISGRDDRFLGIGYGLAMFGGIFGGVVTAAMISTYVEKKAEGKRILRIRYALSDRRAICWLPAGRSPGVKVMMIPSRTIGSIHRVERDDGSGSVRFFGDGTIREFYGFESVGQVRHVENLAREVLVVRDHRGHDEFDVDDGTGR